MSVDALTASTPGLEKYIGSISTQLGNFMFGMGALLALTAAFPYRKGEGWAWYAAWTVPLLLTIQF